MIKATLPTIHIFLYLEKQNLNSIYITHFLVRSFPNYLFFPDLSRQNRALIWLKPHQLLIHTCIKETPGRNSTLFLVGMSGALYGGLKNWFFFAKVRSKKLKIYNILRAKELKFEPNLGCRAVQKFFNFWQICLVGVKIRYFCSKLGSEELNHAVTGDLQNSERGVERGSWLPDIPMPPFQVRAPGRKNLTLLLVAQLHVQRWLVGKM